MVKMIAAVAEGGVIGKEGKIPWDLPEDRRIFRELTMGGTLIVGRRTYESIGGPLPGRDMVVVTSGEIDLAGREQQDELSAEPGAKFSGVEPAADPAPGHVLLAKDLTQAIRMAGDKDAFLCGGERIYQEGMGRADVLYLTKVELRIEGDTYFPADFENHYKLIGRERLSANATLLTYVKK